jgi:hypothetical protein
LPEREAVLRQINKIAAVRVLFWVGSAAAKGQQRPHAVQQNWPLLNQVGNGEKARWDREAERLRVVRLIIGWRLAPRRICPAETPWYTSLMPVPQLINPPDSITRTSKFIALHRYEPPRRAPHRDRSFSRTPRPTVEAAWRTELLSRAFRSVSQPASSSPG